MGVGVIILIWGVQLIVAAMAAGEFEEIARKKGYRNDSKKYWHWCFWALPVGAMLVIALPDLNSRNNTIDSLSNSAHKHSSLPEL